MEFEDRNLRKLKRTKDIIDDVNKYNFDVLVSGLLI